MYVCICKAVSESRIRRAAADGTCTLRDLREQLGVGTGCGKCVAHAYEVLTACRTQHPQRPASRPLYLAHSA